MPSALDDDHAGPGGAAEVPRGYGAGKADHLKRLRRIEGQVRGLQRMIDEDQYCIDILTQVSAASKALGSVAVELLDDHIRHCVIEASATGDHVEAERLLDDATRAIARLVRS